MTADSDGDDHDVALVMPFVVVTSAGGPYEDNAFAAGWRVAMVDAALRHDGATWSGTLRAADLPQVDLVAMRHGRSMETAAEEDGWVYVNVR